MCQLCWTLGAAPGWQRALYAGGSEAVAAALHHLHAFTTHQIATLYPAHRVLDVHVHGTNLTLADAAQFVNWQLHMQPGQHPSMSIAEAVAPGGNTHPTITVQSSQEGTDMFQLQISGNTYPLRHQLHALGLAAETTPTGYVRRSAPLEASALVSWAKDLAPTFQNSYYLCKSEPGVDPALVVEIRAALAATEPEHSSR